MASIHSSLSPSVSAQKVRSTNVVNWRILHKEQVIRVKQVIRVEKLVGLLPPALELLGRLS